MTATTNDGTAAAVLEALDFDPVLSCAMRECGHDAAGYVVTRCPCGESGVAPACGCCYVRAFVSLRVLIRAGLVVCRTCRRKLTDETMRWEPLP